MAQSLLRQLGTPFLPSHNAGRVNVCVCVLCCGCDTVYVGASVTGLLHLRDKGIVHRDLKPSNLLLKGDKLNLAAAELKIADFGMARYLRQDCLAETSVGTP